MSLTPKKVQDVYLAGQQGPLLYKFSTGYTDIGGKCLTISLLRHWQKMAGSCGYVMVDAELT